LHSHDRLFYKQYLAGGKVSCGTRDPPTSRSDTHYELVATAINGGGGECLTHCEHVAVPKRLKILHDLFDSKEKFLSSLFDHWLLVTKHRLRRVCE
jgi:hypothetical protein